MEFICGRQSWAQEMCDFFNNRIVLDVMVSYCYIRILVKRICYRSNLIRYFFFFHFRLGGGRQITGIDIADQRRYFSSINTEQTSKQHVDKHEFKAETRMLLDIVARSLYSENEVFVRELVSNASDALEKFRYTIQTAGEQQNQFESVDRPLEIHLETNKQASTLSFHDTGIGINQFCFFFIDIRQIVYTLTKKKV